MQQTSFQSYGSGFSINTNENSQKKPGAIVKPIDPQVMEDFKQILA